MRASAMIAKFISRHLVSELPESLYELADRDDSTPAGRIFLMSLLLLHAAVAVSAAGTLLA